MTAGPLALGAGLLAAAALLFSSKSASAAEQKVAERKIAAVIPSRKKSGGGGGPVVSFTKRKVLWRTNKKTGKKESRTQVVEEPRVLAAMASEKLGREIPLGIFSLATMIASEAGSGADLAKVAVAHAALTYTKKHGKGKTLHQLLTSTDGHYGGQQGRYASTKNAPSLRDIEIAEAVAAGKIANPAPGAVQWDSPKAQDQLFAEGESGYSSDADGLARKREAEGKVAVFLPGVDQGYLRLWRAAA